VARTIEDRSVTVRTSDEIISEETQQTDSLDRLAVLSARTRPYSIEALAVAVICLSAATGLRLIGSWTNSDFLFATYIPAILAAGLIAGVPAAVGVTIASGFIIRVFFVPSYLHFGQQSYDEYIDFLMYLISAALTISFAHYCRVLLNRLHKRNLTNEILARELQHRSKNVCAVLDVIVRKSLADDPERAKKLFGRIKAMMYANELLTAPQLQLLTLKQLLLQAFAPHGEERLEAFGPEISIEPEAARYLILLIHELVTNAAKYGSLSRLSGRVLVEWQQEEETIILNWKESGGPRIDLPKREGFGSQLAAAALCIGRICLFDQVQRGAVSVTVERSGDNANVRFGSWADEIQCPPHVCFAPGSDSRECGSGVAMAARKLRPRITRDRPLL
jgi:two-component sensor histidine kinase